MRIDLLTQDGTLDCHVFSPHAAAEGGARWPAIILYMDAFGIRPNLDAMAQRLADLGYVVAVPNLYYRSGAVAPFDPKAVTVEGPEQARFRGMIRSIDGPKVMMDTGAVMDHLASRPDVSPGPIGTLGYCMGGGYALLAAGTFPDRVTAAASFHGGSLATDRPDSPHRLAPEMRARVYVGVAEIDHSFDSAQRARVEAALQEAGVRYVLEVYPGTRHGFAVTGHLVYDKAASERHWDQVATLFDQTLFGQTRFGQTPGARAPGRPRTLDSRNPDQ